MKKFFLFFLILVISSSFVNAIPELPMIISGNVTINDKPAKVGTEITARVVDNEVNKVTVAEKGKFTFLLQKLNENDKVDLYVDGINSEVSVDYKSSDYQNLALAVEKPYWIYYSLGGLIGLCLVFLIWKKSRK